MLIGPWILEEGRKENIWEQVGGDAGERVHARGEGAATGEEAGLEDQ